jgi:hypothetical protein
MGIQCIQRANVTFSRNGPGMTPVLAAFVYAVVAVVIMCDRSRQLTRRRSALVWGCLRHGRTHLEIAASHPSCQSL